MKVVVQFDPNQVDDRTLRAWKSKGLTRMNRSRGEMIYHLEERGKEEYPLPPELGGMPLLVLISAEETYRQVVCRYDGQPRLPYGPSLGTCADSISATFGAYKHLVTVEMDEKAKKYIFVDWHVAVPVTLDDVTIIHIFDKPLWEGVAHYYKPSETPGSDFTQAIAAVQKRVDCVESGGRFCKGPHFANLSKIADPAAQIVKNRERNATKKTAYGRK